MTVPLESLFDDPSLCDPLFSKPAFRHAIKIQLYPNIQLSPLTHDFYFGFDACISFHTSGRILPDCSIFLIEVNACITSVVGLYSVKSHWCFRLFDVLIYKILKFKISCIHSLQFTPCKMWKMTEYKLQANEKKVRL